MKVYYPSKTTGSAKKLEGSIYVITFFVSETPWPLNEKMELFKFVRDAESWLEGKAKEYGKTVRFVNGVHGLFEPFEIDVVPDYDSGDPQTDIAQKYLKAAGYPSDTTYPAWIKKNSGCDQSLVPGDQAAAWDAILEPIVTATGYAYDDDWAAYVNDDEHIVRIAYDSSEGYTFVTFWE